VSRCAPRPGCCGCCGGPPAQHAQRVDHIERLGAAVDLGDAQSAALGGAHAAQGQGDPCSHPWHGSQCVRAGCLVRSRGGGGRRGGRTRGQASADQQARSSQGGAGTAAAPHCGLGGAPARARCAVLRGAWGGGRHSQSIWFLNTAVVVPCCSGHTQTCPSDQIDRFLSSCTCGPPKRAGRRGGGDAGCRLTRRAHGLTRSCPSWLATARARGPHHAGSASDDRMRARADGGMASDMGAVPGGASHRSRPAHADLGVALRHLILHGQALWVVHAHIAPQELQDASKLIGQQLAEGALA
jgi:hypothetical protein